jgi:hypothetical protein
MARIDEGTLFLAPGEFSRSDHRYERLTARKLFLDAVNEEFPRVLEDLSKNVLPLFRPFWERVVPEDKRMVSYLYFDQSWSSLYEKDEAEAAIRDAVQCWGNESRLFDEWCLDIAIETMSYWCTCPPSMSGGFSWFVGGEMIEMRLSANEVRFAFEHRGWNPQMGWWRDVSANIEAAFKEQMVAYRQRVIDLATQRGLVPTTRKRPGHKDQEDRAADRHFRWLAQFQVGKWPYPKIWNTAGVDNETVRSGVQGTADFIGLTLRPSDPAGRPPRSGST